MKESTAWRILAEEYDAGMLHSEYLCNNIKSPTTGSRVEKIPESTRFDMIRRIGASLDEPGVAAYEDSLGEPTESFHDARVMACLLFALQAKDDEKEAK